MSLSVYFDIKHQIGTCKIGTWEKRTIISMIGWDPPRSQHHVNTTRSALILANHLWIGRTNICRIQSGAQDSFFLVQQHILPNASVLEVNIEIQTLIFSGICYVWRPDQWCNSQKAWHWFLSHFWKFFGSFWHPFSIPFGIDLLMDFWWYFWLIFGPKMVTKWLQKLTPKWRRTRAEPGTHPGRSRDPFWTHFGVILDPFWTPFWPLLEPILLKISKWLQNQWNCTKSVNGFKINDNCTNGRKI